MSFRTRPRVLRYRLTAAGRSLSVATGALAALAAAATQPAFAAAALAVAALLGVAFVATSLLVWTIERAAARAGSAAPPIALEVGQQASVVLRLPAPPVASLIDWRGAHAWATSGLTVMVTPSPREHLPATHGVAAAPGVAVECLIEATGTGHHALHGVALRCADRLGLVALELYFPAHVAVSVAPPIAALPRSEPHRRARELRPARDGTHPGPRAGHGPTLRELRDYRPGDRQRDLDWAATARTGRWIVREREEERQHALYVALDAGPTMLAGPGAERFTACLALARAHLDRALARGDRAGLVIWDTVTLIDLPPDTGRRHRDALLRCLIDARSPLLRPLQAHDEHDVARAVNQWLLEHAGIDFLAGVASRASPGGGVEQQVQRLDAWCRYQLLADELAPADTSTAFDPDDPSELAAILAFADRWSIELPPPPWDDARARDIAADAALRTARERLGDGDRLVVVSDLASLARPADVAGFLREATHGRVQVEVHVPWAVPPSGSHASRSGRTPRDEVERATDAVLAHGEHARLRVLAEHFAAAAVPLHGFDPWAGGAQAGNAGPVDRVHRVARP